MKTDNLEMLFLGTGSAFTVGEDNYHSNMLLSLNQSRLLIDCGSDIRFSLDQQGLSYDDIDDIYISHLHADHVGGLEWLGFNRKFSSTKKKPVLHISKKLERKLWQNVLSGCMSSLSNEPNTLETYFTVKPIGDSRVFIWNGIRFNIVPTIHTKNNNKLNPSYGLFFKYGNTKIFLTTDTAFCPQQYEKLYIKADMIFHDCETKTPCSGVHSHYQELRMLPPDIKSKIWLYHYNPGPLPNATKDGFLGFVKKGQRFDLER